MTQIPVIILSGFLGAGKTTLLKHVIQSFKESELSITLIMNEFGDLNIDGKILGEDISMKELLQGCLCCSIRDDLTSTLKEISFLERPDVVVVECTGLANPFEVIDAFIQPSLINAYKVAKVISVIDGREALQAPFTPLIEDQIKYADLLLVNKADLMTESEIASVTSRVRGLVHSAVPVIATTQSKINIWDHLSPASAESGAKTTVEKGNYIPKHLESVHSFSYRFNHIINRKHFTNWLSTLGKNILRMKGFIPFEDGLYLFQYTPAQASFHKIDWPVTEEKLVCIGTSLNKQQLYDGIKACEGNMVK